MEEVQEVLEDLHDAQLVDRALQGNREAFGVLVGRYEARLRGFTAAHSLASKDDVFDIVQDTFVDAYCHLHTFDINREFMPWIRAICRNRIAKFYQERQKRRPANLGLVDDAIAERFSQRQNEELYYEERIDALKACVRELKGPGKHAVDLRYFEGRSIEEMASAMHQSSSSLAMVLVRARRRLRKCIEWRLSSGGQP